jgi:hypothetical protein
MSYDADGAIQVLQDGLKIEKKNRFQQADSLVIPPSFSALWILIYGLRQLVFELAWTLLSQRRYQESADMFMKMIELNSWCASRKKSKSLFLTRSAGVMPPTTSSLQVGPITGLSYINPPLPSYRMLHPDGKLQEGSGTLGCLPCPDGSAETWSSKIPADGGLHSKEECVHPTKFYDCILKIPYSAVL